jgi:hypothetical protein
MSLKLESKPVRIVAYGQLETSLRAAFWIDRLDRVANIPVSLAGSFVSEVATPIVAGMIFQARLLW